MAKTANVVAFTRKCARQPFPEHLPRDRVVEPGPTVCLCCGSARLRKLGEDITETLEVIPRQWKVIQHVREKFTCRDCEKISQAPSPFHVLARGWAGPSLLATVSVREVRTASAAQPPGRTLRQGGRAPQPVHPGRSGRRLLRGWRRSSAGSRPCLGRQAVARRRHYGAGPGQGKDRYSAMLG